MSAWDGRSTFTAERYHFFASFILLLSAPPLKSSSSSKICQVVQLILADGVRVFQMITEPFVPLETSWTIGARELRDSRYGRTFVAVVAQHGGPE